MDFTTCVFIPCLPFALNLYLGLACEEPIEFGRNSAGRQYQGSSALQRDNNRVLYGLGRSLTTHEQGVPWLLLIASDILVLPIRATKSYQIRYYQCHLGVHRHWLTQCVRHTTHTVREPCRTAATSHINQANLGSRRPEATTYLHWWAGDPSSLANGRYKTSIRRGCIGVPVIQLGHLSPLTWRNIRLRWFGPSSFVLSTHPRDCERERK
jgi:hypothetical protein